MCLNVRSMPVSCTRCAAGLGETARMRVLSSETRIWMGNNRLGSWLLVGAAGVGLLSLAVMPTPAQAPAYKAPKTKDGKPNLNGIWQANNEANWDIRPHGASQGPVYTIGAAYSKPAEL